MLRNFKKSIIPKLLISVILLGVFTHATHNAIETFTGDYNKNIAHNAEHQENDGKKCGDLLTDKLASSNLDCVLLPHENNFNEIFLTQAKDFYIYKDPQIILKSKERLILFQIFLI